MSAKQIVKRIIQEKNRKESEKSQLIKNEQKLIVIIKECKVLKEIETILKAKATNLEIKRETLNFHIKKNIF